MKPTSPARPAPPPGSGENSAWERYLDRVVLTLARTPLGRSGRGRPRGIMHAFRLAERLLEHGHTTYPLRPEGIVRYEIAPLPARRPLPLPNRPPVRRGERVIVIHLDNGAMAELAGRVPNGLRLTWHIARIASADLQELADRVRAGSFPGDVRAIWGETLIYTSLTRYGFRIRPAPRTLRTPFVRLFMLSLFAIYGRPGALDGEHALQHFQLGEAWASLADLQRRFPPRAGTPRDPTVTRHTQAE